MAMGLKNAIRISARMSGRFRACSLVAGGVLAATLAVADASAVQAADLVVLKAEKSTLRPGSMVSSEGALTLAAGESVTLLGEDGRVQVLKGPWKGQPSVRGTDDESKSRAVSVIAALLQENRKSSLSLGVVRSAGKVVKVPDPWAVNVTESGTGCIRSERATLWRTANIDQESRVTLSARNSPQKAVVNWVAGYELLHVPGQLFSNGRTYTVDLDGNTVELQVHVMPQEVATGVEQAVWMANAGCKSQALALLGEM